MEGGERPTTQEVTTEGAPVPQAEQVLASRSSDYVWIMSVGEDYEGSEILEVFTDPRVALDEFALEAKCRGFPRAEAVRVMLEFHRFRRGPEYLQLQRHPVRSATRPRAQP